MPRVCPIYFLEILVLELTGVYGDSATGVGDDWSQIGGGSTSSKIAFSTFTNTILKTKIL